MKTTRQADDNQKQVDALRKEVEDHLATIKKQENASAFNSPNLIISNFAHLMARIAELSEISTSRLVSDTKAIKNLTKTLIVLTAVLVVFTLLLLVLTYLLVKHG